MVGAALIPAWVETGRLLGAYDPAKDPAAYDELGLPDPG